MTFADWTSPSSNTVWQDGYKTLFDPCPVDWRVPKAGGSSPWQALHSEMHTFVNGTWDVTNKGARWTAPAVYGGNTWYPASGLRANGSGKLGDYGTRGLFWAVGTGLASSYFNVAQNDTFLNSAVHAYCFPVRCVRE